MSNYTTAEVIRTLATVVMSGEEHVLNSSDSPDEYNALFDYIAHKAGVDPRQAVIVLNHPDSGPLRVTHTGGELAPVIDVSREWLNATLKKLSNEANSI